MTKKISTRLQSAWAHTRRVSGNAAASASEFVDAHKQTIADGTQVALEKAGLLSESAGRKLQSRAQNLRRESPVKRQGVTGAGFEGILERATDASLKLTSLLGRSLGSAGESTRKASAAIGAATGGIITGTVGAVSGAVDAIAIQQSDIYGLEVRLTRAGDKARFHSRLELERIEAARRQGHRGELLDLLVIGGASLSHVLANPTSVPADVERAFELAYPGLVASGETFTDAVARMPTDDLVGLVSGVKGKLFELQLVDQLNGGGLEEGLHAEIAASANQPGYDIRILDAEGQTADLLQAKASDSVAYVREALERYPHVDVTTTSEVHGQLMALGLSEQVSDSGLSDAFLQGKVESAAGLDGSFSTGDFVPSALGLAVIAFSAFSAQGAGIIERSEQFGERAGKAGLSGGAGAAAMAVTGMWLFAPVAGLGFRAMVIAGDAKRKRYGALKRIVESLEADNARRSGKLTVVRSLPTLAG